jgi:hypothetical protein
MWDDFAQWEQGGSDPREVDVHESREPEWTGLYDARGPPLYRRPEPITAGFLRFDTCREPG